MGQTGIRNGRAHGRRRGQKIGVGASACTKCACALIIGLASRLTAIALLVMTLVYPEARSVHLLWATALVYIIARGPGVLSLDHLLKPARG